MMTSSTGNGRSGGNGRGGGLLGTLSSPAASRLGEAAREYARAQGANAARRVGERFGGVTDSLINTAGSGGFKATAAGDVVKRVVQGENPVKSALESVGSGVKEKVSGLVERKKGGRPAGGDKKFMSIVEDIYVGVPVSVAYDQWTQFQEFPSFMKGVDSIEQTDEVNSNWRVKVFKSRRNWKGTVTEQIPDRKIAWTTDGDKGSTKGVVTFHPLADDLTQVLLVMEYYPAGFFETAGNLWRAPGRRARLDLKHFRRFIMMRGEATGSWRGEIRDGEVVRSPEEEEDREQLEQQEQPRDLEGSERQAGDRRAEAGEEEWVESEGAEEAEEEPEEEPVQAKQPRPSRRREPVGSQ